MVMEWYENLVAPPGVVASCSVSTWNGGCPMPDAPAPKPPPPKPPGVAGGAPKRPPAAGAGAPNGEAAGAPKPPAAGAVPLLPLA